MPVTPRSTRRLKGTFKSQSLKRPLHTTKCKHDPRKKCSWILNIIFVIFTKYWYIILLTKTYWLSHLDSRTSYFSIFPKMLIIHMVALGLGFSCLIYTNLIIHDIVVTVVDTSTIWTCLQGLRYLLYVFRVIGYHIGWKTSSTQTLKIVETHLFC